MQIKYWIAVVLIILLLFLLLFKLIGFNMGTTILSSTLLSITIFLILSITTIFIMLPKKNIPQTNLFINIHNQSPIIDFVSINIPSINVPISLRGFQSEYGIPILPLDIIEVTGYVNSKKMYSFSYVNQDITNVNLYITTGGIFNDTMYSVIDIINTQDKDYVLSTKDFNGNVIPFITAKQGITNVGVYVGQEIFLSSKGIIYINTGIKSITISKDLFLNITLKDGNLSFKNSTEKTAVLQSKNPWEIDAKFINVATLQKGDTSSSIIVYVTQEWRLVDSDGNQITNIYSVTNKDIIEQNIIKLY